MKIRILAVTIACTMMVVSCSRKPETSGPTGGGGPAGPRAEVGSDLVTMESRAAAEDINNYIRAHQSDLAPKLKSLNYDFLKGPEELNKYRQLLPDELQARFDLAKPAIIIEMKRGVMTHHLQQIKFAMLDYKDKGVAVPRTLGEWAILIGKDDKDALGYFIEPWDDVPSDVQKGSPAEQADWVNSHTIYELIDGGKGLGDITAIVAIEKLDHMPNEPKMLMLTGLAVETIRREEVKGQLGRP